MAKKPATTKSKTDSDQQTPPELTPEQQKKADAKAESEQDVKDKAAADAAKSTAKTGHVVFASRYKNYNARGVQFEGGKFTTDDSRVINKLESHPAFKSEFWRIVVDAA